MSLVIELKDGVQLEIIARRPEPGHPKRSHEIALTGKQADRVKAAVAKAYATSDK